MAKDSFIMRKKYGEPLSKLSTTQKAQLLDAIFYRQNTGELSEGLDPMAEMIMSIMIQEWMKDNKSYEQSCKKNKINGSMGGRPKKKPTGFSKNPPVIKKNQKPDMIGYDMIGGDVIGSDKKINTPPISPSREEARDTPTPRSLLLAYESNAELVEAYGGSATMLERLEYKQRKKDRAYKTSTGFLQQLKIILPKIEFGKARGDLPTRFRFAVNQAMEFERKSIYRNEQTEREYQDFKSMSDPPGTKTQ